MIADAQLPSPSWIGHCRFVLDVSITLRQQRRLQQAEAPMVRWWWADASPLRGRSGSGYKSTV